VNLYRQSNHEPLGVITHRGVNLCRFTGPKPKAWSYAVWMNLSHQSKHVPPWYMSALSLSPTESSRASRVILHRRPCLHGKQAKWLYKAWETLDFLAFLSPRTYSKPLKWSCRSGRSKFQAQWIRTTKLVFLHIFLFITDVILIVVAIVIHQFLFQILTKLGKAALLSHKITWTFSATWQIFITSSGWISRQNLSRNAIGELVGY
jgi:hypothetical protein